MSASADQVDLWLCRVDEIDFHTMTHDYWNLLSEVERARHERFHFEKDRRLFLATRALARTVLSRYLGVAPRAVEFSANSHGRPVLGASHGASNLAFNISHADCLVALAIATDEVGIDVESLRSRQVPIELADHYFCAFEAADLRQLSAQSQETRFIEYWTLKEAYIKARGLGLSLELNRFGFRFHDDLELEFSTEQGVDDAAHWNFAQLLFEQDYVLALCVTGRDFGSRGLCARKAVPLVSESQVLPHLLRKTSAASRNSIVREVWG